jgi:hypothetical protein
VVEDALSDTLGRQLTSQTDFTSCISMGSVTTQSWIDMLSLFAEQLFRLDSVLSQPMVGLPFVDSLVRGLLLAAEHPYRSVVTRKTQSVCPCAIRAAVEVIEEEAQLPLTVSSIAARCHVNVRSLQQDFGVTWERRRWPICMRSGCVGHIRVGVNPIPRRLVSLRLPTTGFYQPRPVRRCAHSPLRRAPGRDTAATGLSGNSIPQFIRRIDTWAEPFRRADLRTSASWRLQLLTTVTSRSGDVNVPGAPSQPASNDDTSVPAIFVCRSAVWVVAALAGFPNCAVGERASIRASRQ